MTAKQYLGQIRHLDRRIRIKQRDIEDLRSRATSLSCPTDNAPRPSGSGDRVGSAAVRIADLEREAQADRDRYNRQRQEIVAVIDSVPDSLLSDILNRRYVHGQTWEQIAEDTHYTLRWVYILHGRALREVERLMNSSL